LDALKCQNKAFGEFAAKYFIIAYKLIRAISKVNRKIFLD
jgi:hypothetical protein